MSSYRHTGGDDEDGCVDCYVTFANTGDPDPKELCCKQAENDPDEPGLCAWCSDPVEPA